MKLSAVQSVVQKEHDAEEHGVTIVESLNQIMEVLIIVTYSTWRW